MFSSRNGRSRAEVNRCDVAVPRSGRETVCWCIDFDKVRERDRALARASEVRETETTNSGTGIIVTRQGGGYTLDTFLGSDRE